MTHPENLAQETQRIWNQLGSWWDNHIQEGNEFHCQLIAPITERLLELKPGEKVLDIACGNGQFSRQMARLGADVVAFDFSESFLACARQRTPEELKIAYHQIDATNIEQLLALGIQQFDAAVANMALMDIADIEPLLEALQHLLKPGGRFIFSVLHPCFNSCDSQLMAEEVLQNEQMKAIHSVKIFQYIHPLIYKGVGIIEQPVSHYYFHRPLSQLLNSCFDVGFVLDRLEEPTFSPQNQPQNGLLSWGNLPEIPPAIIVRLRLSPQ